MNVLIIKAGSVFILSMIAVIATSTVTLSKEVYQIPKPEWENVMIFLNSHPPAGTRLADEVKEFTKRPIQINPNHRKKEKVK
jgi:hypothetical protein